MLTPEEERQIAAKMETMRPLIEAAAAPKADAYYDKLRLELQNARYKLALEKILNYVNEPNAYYGEDTVDQTRMRAIAREALGLDCKACQEDEGKFAACKDCGDLLCERCIKKHSKDGCGEPDGSFQCDYCNHRHFSAPAACRAAHRAGM